MVDRDSQLDKMLMGAPIGIAAAAVAYGGGHWVIVAMLGVVSIIVTANASIESVKTGAVGYAAVGMALVIVPVGFAAMILFDREQPSSAVATAARVGDATGALERATGAMRDGVAGPKTNGQTSDLVSFAEVAQHLKAAKRADVNHPDVRYAVDRVKAWDAIGVRDFSVIDPATGRPAMPAVRWEALARARKSFEDKLALNGRQAMLTVEEAAWAAFTLGADP